ncbi:hypothetical protein N7E70_015850 [Aminobacter sp. NyZ550]|uniref:hypothetical protein n=1 Tax=Aminobacter sp. NyZ550 TaxID=2979870 RepID=UPI0021D5C7E0|nr:hypothetical protein [Aminobacter sp. NyZ550]WAX93171.1 hypothetical protein N7E70_015850 [Aminobacter sp. NyZ550]
MSRVLRSFREMLGLLSRGDFSRKLDEEMTAAIDALEAMPGDKGKAVMTVSITFNYELGRIDIDPAVKVKLPDTARFMKTPFWTIDGALSVEHPNQINMFAPAAVNRHERDDDEIATG